MIAHTTTPPKTGHHLIAKTVATLLAITRLLTTTPPKTRVMANEAEMEAVFTSPQDGLGIETAAANETMKNDRCTWVHLAPYGDFDNSQGLQRFERKDADEIVKNFSSLMANVAPAIFGSPVYIGHPDHPAFAERYKDGRAYGRVKGLEARPQGLFANVKWSEAGWKLLQEEAYNGASVNWRLRKEGAVWRPFSIKSVGLTNEPNIPVQPLTAANEKGKTMWKELAKLLGLPETATEQQTYEKAVVMANELPTLRGQVTSLTTERDTARTTLTTVQGEVTAANEKATAAITRATTAEGQVQTLTSKVQTLETAKTTAETNFANERAARIKGILDDAIVVGRITAADRPKWETEMANETSFSAKATELLAIKPTIKTESTVGTLGDRKPVVDRLGKFQDMVNEKMRTPGMSYDEAYASVVRDNPNFFPTKGS